MLTCLCALCAIVFIVRRMSSSHHWERRCLGFEQRVYGETIPEDGATWGSDVEENDSEAEISAEQCRQEFLNLNRAREHHRKDCLHLVPFGSRRRDGASWHFVFSEAFSDG